MIKDATNIVIINGMVANRTVVPVMSKTEQKTSAKITKQRLAVDPTPKGSGNTVIK